MDYKRAQSYWKDKEQTSQRMDPPMNLIRIQPVRADFLNSEFKAEGFDSRQQYIWQ